MIKRLSALLADIRYDKLPASTLAITRTAVLNFFGGSLPGADKPLTLAEGDFWRRQNALGASVILGSGETASPLAAAAVNAAMGEIFLSEDVHMPTSSHPGMIVIPVAMAAGQEARASGKTVIEAIVAGYEIMGRLGAALIAPGFARNGLRPASWLAPFGGAVAAVLVKGGGAAELERAIAIAGNTAAGVMEFVNAGTADICIQNCFAAKTALMSAELALSGIAGAPSILDGRFGLGLALTNAPCDWDKMFEDRKDGYVINETTVKAYPGCAYVQASAQAARHFAKIRRLTPDEIESVTAGVTQASKDWPGVDCQGPFTGTISAMMSHQFMISSSLVHDRIDAETVSDFHNAQVAAMAQKITVVVDEAIQAKAPGKSGARLTFRLKNGEILEHLEEDVIPLDRDGVIERLKQAGKDYFTPQRLADIVSVTLDMDSLADINTLMCLLKPNK